MFSEYASRFLAQSQSRLSFSQNDPNASRNPLERQRGQPPRPSSRSYLQRQPQGNPYQGTSARQSRFPFASRLGTNTTQAPLFYSATDEFREEDDGEEHEREVADFYALQRSRRDFGASRVTDSSESDRDVEETEDPTSLEPGGFRRGRHGFRGGRGIRSSWTGENDRPEDGGNRTDDHASTADPSETEFTTSGRPGKLKDRLVDVELASTIHEDEEPVEHSKASGDVTIDVEDPPSIQQFRRPPSAKQQFWDSQILPQDRISRSSMAFPRPQSPGTESVAPTVAPSTEAPRYDSFWGSLFMLCLASVFASFVVVWFHTTATGGNLGDTVYTVLHSSFYLLAVDTLVAVIVALLWLSVLRSFVRPLVYSIVVAVPILLFSFSLYPFISSFNGRYHGSSIQDKVMRWFSFAPFIGAMFWTYTAWKGRHSFQRAIGLLEFTTRVLANNQALVPFGFTVLGSVIAWTWIWMFMFTRVFLGGHLSDSKNYFIIDAGTWWLGTFFILVYLWTLGVISGLQRTTAAATVSQWYFHRFTVPQPSSPRVVQASFTHATTTIFGTICLSTLLSLAIRLPLLLLPRRFASYITVCFYSLIPTSIATLINPLTLTYAAIHSQPLSLSARGLAEMSFVSSTSPTTTLTPHTAADHAKHNHYTHGTPPNPIFAYRLAKLLLHATRFATSLAFGFGGWVSTARMLSIQESGATVRGSLYAYIVGLIAGAIGWAVLGAMEGVLGGVLDALVVCWGSDGGRYCREAGVLFGGEGAQSIGAEEVQPLTHE